MLKKTKIIATIGPISSTPHMIDMLYHAGVDVFRINCSHTQDPEPLVHRIRALESRYQRPTTIIADLQGPKWRVGAVDDAGVTLQKGQDFVLDTDTVPGNNERAPFLHPELYQAVQVGDTILLNDGVIHLKVVDVGPQKWRTRVEQGGVLLSYKGVNIPYLDYPTAFLTDKDYSDLAHLLQLGVDWIALSFVQCASDITMVRRWIQEHDNNTCMHPRLIAKIEKPAAAVEHLDAIVAEADGLMVARGDLGVEMPLEEVPPIQRRIIAAARSTGKPVIVATQMLESMIRSSTPTRAEVSDVAHAVYDGADAVMLSGESAVGQFPIETVKVMSSIIQSVEKDPLYRDLLKWQTTPVRSHRSDALTVAAKQVTSVLSIATLFSCSLTGRTPMHAARERPEAPIVALTPSLAVARQLGLVWGVESLWMRKTHDLSDITQCVCTLAYQKGLAQAGDYIIVLSGMPLWKTGGTNILSVEVVDSQSCHNVNVHDYLESYV